MNIIDRLDKYQSDNNLKAADMARLFNVVPQKYNNWRYRCSLPKEFYPRAEELLKTRLLRIEETPAEYQVKELVNIGKLSKGDQQIIKSLITSLERAGK